MEIPSSNAPCATRHQPPVDETPHSGYSGLVRRIKTPSINIYEAKTRFSALVAEIEESGVAVTICRNGKPVAELRPYAVPRPDPFAADPALRVIFHQDPSLPLDPEDWPEAFS